MTSALGVRRWTLSVGRCLVLCLLLAAVVQAADKPALSAEEQTAFNERQYSKASQLARSPHGLLITHFGNDDAGWVQVGVTNLTTKPVTFDVHQLRARDLVTGAVFEGGEVRFRVKDRIDYTVPPGLNVTFVVRFTGNSRYVAALTWAGLTVWHDEQGLWHETADPIIRQANLKFAERRARERAAQVTKPR